MVELCMSIVGHTMCQNEYLRRIKVSIENGNLNEALRLIDTASGNNQMLIDGLTNCT